MLPRLVEAGALAIEITCLRVELAASWRRWRPHARGSWPPATRSAAGSSATSPRRRSAAPRLDRARARHAQHELASGAAQVPGTLDAAVAELAVAVAQSASSAPGCLRLQLDAGLAPALREPAFVRRCRPEVRATTAKLAGALRRRPTSSPARGWTNAVKHANASKVVLSAAKVNGKLVMSVADDGVGGAAEPDGSGLRGPRTGSPPRAGCSTSAASWAPVRR